MANVVGRQGQAEVAVLTRTATKKSKTELQQKEPLPEIMGISGPGRVCGKGRCSMGRSV